MGLYERWCDATKEKDKRKHYWTYVEKDTGRDEIRDDLAETVRSHYDRLERIADDVERLGYKVAASILSEAMPQTPKGRSGDLGEILATELVEEEIGLRVPVRRLRYKDGRNMARCQRRRKNQPRGGAKVYHLGDRVVMPGRGVARLGTRAPRIAGVCQGALVVLGRSLLATVSTA